jgi:hypothetical protein
MPDESRLHSSRYVWIVEEKWRFPFLRDFVFSAAICPGHYFFGLDSLGQGQNDRRRGAGHLNLYWMNTPATRGGGVH